MHYRNHLLHYLVLLLFVVFGLVGFWYLSFSRFLQFVDVGVTLFSYVVWGILHHYFEGRLYPKVIFEYILVSLIILLSVSFLLRY